MSSHYGLISTNQIVKKKKKKAILKFKKMKLAIVV